MPRPLSSAMRLPNAVLVLVFAVQALTAYGTAGPCRHMAAVADASTAATAAHGSHGAHVHSAPSEAPQSSSKAPCDCIGTCQSAVGAFIVRAAFETESVESSHARVVLLPPAYRALGSSLHAPGVLPFPNGPPRAFQA